MKYKVRRNVNSWKIHILGTLRICIDTLNEIIYFITGNYKIVAINRLKKIVIFTEEFQIKFSGQYYWNTQRALWREQSFAAFWFPSWRSATIFGIWTRTDSYCSFGIGTWMWSFAFGISHLGRIVPSRMGPNHLGVGKFCLWNQQGMSNGNRL